MNRTAFKQSIRAACWVFSIGIVGITTPAADDGVDYSVGELLLPCVEGDADARWGEDLQAACDQYIRGFIDAVRFMPGAARKAGVCIPDRKDQVMQIRWAFIKWAATQPETHSLPAGEGMAAAISKAFPCQ